MIYIDDIPSFRNPESYKVTVDDRIQKIEVINGVALQDYLHIAAGDVISLTCLFTEENFNQLLALWERRTSVTFTDTAGATYPGKIIIMKEYERDRNFPTHILVTFELWQKGESFDGGGL